MVVLCFTFSSSEIAEDQFSQEWAQVVGFIDETYGADPDFKSGFGIPERNNLYLILPSDSAWAKINQGAQTYDYSPQPWSEQPWGNSRPNLNKVGSIQIDGLELFDETIPTFSSNGDKSIRNQWTYGVAYRDTDDVEGLIYVGRVDYPNFGGLSRVINSSQLIYNGYEFVKERFLIRTRLKDSNIYESLNLANNLRANKDHFPNQIIFSEPVTNELYSGGRIFDYKSFVDVSSDHGPILGLHAYRSIILIFTERAIGIIRVGEALTRTASGETFVNTEEFLSSPEWVLTNVKGYYDKSVYEADTGIYFSDGVDLYVYNGQLQNLTQGTLNISGGDLAITGYDPVNREVLFTINPNETYAYSLDLKQWYGPYTYTPRASFTYKGDLYSIMDGRIVKHNEGNIFVDVPYDTVVDGGANDFGDATTVKTYRKMLLETNTNDMKLLYSHNYNLDELSRSFFWRVKSRVENFVLRMIGLDFFVRGRR